MNLNVLSGGLATVAGTLGEGGAGASITLQAKIGGRWRTRASALAGAHGRFFLAFRARSLGSAPVRLRSSADGAISAFPPAGCIGACAPSAQLASTRRRAQIRPRGTTACGIDLTPQTLGVANRTLPCGTLVTLHYGTRTIRVPVIDRGPFVEGREYDLTEATKDALDFPSLGVVWSTY
jgi:rare lipoprotein A